MSATKSNSTKRGRDDESEREAGDQAGAAAGAGAASGSGSSSAGASDSEQPAAKRLKVHHHCHEAESVEDGKGEYPCLDCGFENPFLVITPARSSEERSCCGQQEGKEGNVKEETKKKQKDGKVR
jgi:hypothetical protein